MLDAARWEIALVGPAVPTTYPDEIFQGMDLEGVIRWQYLFRLQQPPRRWYGYRTEDLLFYLSQHTDLCADYSVEHQWHGLQSIQKEAADEDWIKAAIAREQDHLRKQRQVLGWVLDQRSLVTRNGHEKGQLAVVSYWDGAEEAAQTVPGEALYVPSTFTVTSDGPTNRERIQAAPRGEDLRPHKPEEEPPVPLVGPGALAKETQPQGEEVQVKGRRGPKPMLTLPVAKLRIAKAGRRLMDENRHMSRKEAAKAVGVHPQTLKTYFDLLDEMLEDEKINAVKPP